MRSEKDSTAIESKLLAPGVRRRGSGSDEGGYILAVILVGVAISVIWMSALLPAWRQQAMREREAELIYRGEQWARAIALYAAKNNGTLPQNIDVLLSQKYLRKKYLDPITGEEFIYLGAVLPGQISSSQSSISNPVSAGTRPGQSQAAQGPVSNQPGIYGVQSRSMATSIKVYQGQQQYNLWPFTYQLALARGVGGGRGRQQGPGGRGGPGAGRGGEDRPITPGRGIGGGRGPGGAPGAPPPPPPPGAPGRGAGS
ncbi:MAG TPA: hypothetical protein VFO19_07575 [Vicinamibacterales bacterium]|nr:hypothetical protein [Vicinamibacterales bacterium]